MAIMAAGFLPALAMAHPGHDHTASFVAGALHPLSGIDHLLGLMTVGLLAGRLGGKYLWPLTAALLGLLVAAWTADSDGWRYAAGFMLSGAGLVAAGVTATNFLVRVATAAAPRSPTSAATTSSTPLNAD